LNLKAVEGYPEHGGDIKGHNVSLADLAQKLNKGETTIKMMQWLDENAPEEVKGLSQLRTGQV